MNPHLHRELALIRADEARRTAAERRRAADMRQRRSIVNVLRRAYVARTARAPALPIAADDR
jgi:hypothetical protein